MIKNYFPKFLPIILICLISLIGIFPFFHSGFFPTHDGEWMVVRFSDFHRSLVDGQWPVRFAGRLNFGFGYPVFDFLYPGTFYFTEIFHLLKLNFVDSIKTSFLVSYLLSGLFMYLFAKQWWGKWGGLAAAVLYLFTPYRFVDMYVRGSLGESVSFMFPPLILWTITKLSKTSKNNNTNYLWTVIGAIGVAGLVTTHNVMAYLFLPIVLLYAILVFLISVKEKKLYIIHCTLLIIFGSCASMFFWLPALWDKQFTIFDRLVVAEFSQNFPSLRELILPSWGFGPSRLGDPTSMSFQIGIINWLVIILTTVLLKCNKVLSKISLFFLAITILAIFFMTSFSRVFWRFIPGLSLIQFPWRILSVTTFISAFLAGFVVKEISNKKSWQFAITILLIILAIVLNYSYIKPKEFVNRGEGFYTTNDDTTTVQNEYLPIWVKNLSHQRALNKVELIEGKGLINGLAMKSNKIGFDYTGSAGLIKINTVYFPGWKVLVNGTEKNIIIDKQGLINLKLEAGKSLVNLKFVETPVRKLSDLVSVVSILLIIGLLVVRVNKRKIILQ